MEQQPPKTTDSTAPSLDYTENAVAPPSSHIGRFGINGDELFVTFKNERTGGETGSYVYSFQTPQDAAAVYEAMKESAHPYSEVLYPDAIMAGIPFHKG